MTAQRTALKSGGFAASVRKLRNFTNHPYPSLERRGLARFQFIHTLIDRAYSAPHQFSLNLSRNDGFRMLISP